MKEIYIDSKLLNYNSIESAGIMEALIKLSNTDYLIYSETEKISNDLIKLYKTENIHINNFNSKNIDAKIVLDDNNKIKLNEIFYNSVKEVVEYLLKPQRIYEVIRNTKETKITVKINLDGEGKSDIKTGIGFFDHMLDQIARHANINLTINVNGDLEVDEHHTIEDTGLAFGEAIKKALGNKAGIKRYGYYLPMDDSIAKCAIDLGGRSYINFKCKFNREKVGDFPTELTDEFFKSVAAGMSSTIYLRAKGKNDHHKIECMFKAFAKSLNEAVRIDERVKNQLPSTKGVI